jgi:hypothetical protein
LAARYPHVARLEAESLLTALAARVSRIEFAGPVARHRNNTLRLARHPRPPAPELRTMRQVKAVIELVTINVPGPGEAVVKIQAL